MNVGRARACLSIVAALIIASGCSYASLGDSVLDREMISDTESTITGATVEAIATQTGSDGAWMVSREGRALCRTHFCECDRITSQKTCALPVEMRGIRADAAATTGSGAVWLWFRDLGVIDVFSSDLSKRERTITIDLAGLTGAQIARGIIPAEGGHVLIATSEPPALTEFGPAGSAPTGRAATGLGTEQPAADRLVALGSWQLPDQGPRRVTRVDVASADAQGRLWMLCGETRSLSVLDPLDPAAPTAKVATSFILPVGLGTPEAIAPLASGRWFVLHSSNEKASVALLSPKP